MAADDLSRLKIDKTAKAVKTSLRKRPMLIIGGAGLAVLAAVLYWMGVFTPAQSVEVATVSQTYPSQSFTLLNASGYVVAQRKAAVASKITSRLIELSVEEGSRVKKGDIIARLEGEDVPRGPGPGPGERECRPIQSCPGTGGTRRRKGLFRAGEGASQSGVHDKGFLRFRRGPLQESHRQCFRSRVCREGLRCGSRGGEGERGVHTPSGAL